ncbi:hypothetical protein BD410DRAFT_784344 [Rickenella mellea]|uniref:EF-hand domain-containing protein n=1 Tax=Rickenella mellea TaxID=50990 RepID=A0A4Y7QF20_9AGAM|nr:hypothetical protein BD410DRAFT_784344 [Rickenella mellea]
MSHPPQPRDYEPVSLRHPDGKTPTAAGFHQNIEGENEDAFSAHSMSPLTSQPHRTTGYAPVSTQLPTQPAALYRPGMPHSESHLTNRPNGSHPTNSRNSSWDLLSGIKKFEHEYEEFDSRNASEAHLQFADGDLPKNKFARLYNYLLNVSIITRWALFIVPILALLWIPGILGLTAFPKATLWQVKLIWWSIWLSVVWGGWWAALAFARLLPHVGRHTVGVVAVASRRYIDWLGALHRYVALFGWSLSIWIAFTALIITGKTKPTAQQVILISKLLFAIFLCAALLLFEKFSIQWIAGKFHEKSYAERIADQKRAVKTLVTLYSHSSDIPTRSDTLKDGGQKGIALEPKRFFKQALRGFRNVATTTTTALGNVASEIAGSSVLQPNSPQAMVQTALASVNKSRLLARRLYYSFRSPDRDVLLVQDIANFFPTRKDARAAFALFDKDDNGDVSRDEMELACLDCHREQLSIEHSMQDLDSAVGRLDNILMSLYVIIAIVIIAVALEAQVATLLTGAGTLVLGLSWLIGGSLQEVLTSIIFLFVKHPYDVGDRVDIGTDSYTVQEIRLLSTVFLNKRGCLVQAPNTVLNAQYIQNIRRSPQMSETFEFHVSYGTTFEQIEALRSKMLAYVKMERRDFLPNFDVVVIDIPDQEKMILSADIKYKSNWQQGALKVKRRNKWVCALKTCLAELKIHGPSGDPDADSGPKRYTEVPWPDVQEEDRKKEKPKQPAPPASDSPVPRGDWNLSDGNAAAVDTGEDIYGEADQLRMTNPKRGIDPRTGGGTGTSTAPTMATARNTQMAQMAASAEAYEMTANGTQGSAV